VKGGNMNYQDVYNKIKNDGLSQILLADKFYKNGKKVISKEQIEEAYLNLKKICDSGDMNFDSVKNILKKYSGETDISDLVKSFHDDITGGCSQCGCKC